MSRHDELSRAKYCAFLILGRKSYTSHELYEKLIKNEYSQESCEQVVEYMESEGYINDRDYAERYAHDAVTIKRHGTGRIKSELKRRGVPEEIIEQAITQLDISNEETVSIIVRQKAEKADLRDKKQRDRLVGYLLRRGFSYGEIFAALKEYYDEYVETEGDF